jgi:hypothetical protein
MLKFIMPQWESKPGFLLPPPQQSAKRFPAIPAPRSTAAEIRISRTESSVLRGGAPNMRRFLAVSAAAAMIIGSTALSGRTAPLPGKSSGSNSENSSADITDFTDTPSNPSLKDVLAKGLLARRPEEFAFVDRVVKMVDHRQLSREMVETTFLWARKKSNSHPFVYFEHGLKLRAQQAGVNL